MLRSLTLSLVVLAVAACKDHGSYADAAPPTDGTPVDATATAPSVGLEITTGGGRMRGQRFIADVQVGHGVVQRPTRGRSVTLEGNAPVKP
jgi:hypothetical protein